MGRKNNNVRRANDKGRLTRRSRGETRIKPNPTIQIDVEKMVMPDGRCTFGNPRRPKARFATEEKAREALKQAQLKRKRTGSGHVEKRFFKCPEGGCGGFHLTSRESYDEDVSQFRREQYRAKTKNARLAEIRQEAAGE